MKNKPDLVYMLGGGSKWDNNELRYSIRSAVKNFRSQFGRIFIVGIKPEWLQGVLQIRMRDPYSCKLQNVIEKLKAVCKDERVSEKFILMNDDFFFLKPGTLKTMHLGNIDNQIKKHKTKSGYYYEALIKTKVMLQENFKVTEVKSYEVHAPMAMDKQVLLPLLEIAGATAQSFLFRSIYGNASGIGGAQVTDFKAYQQAELAYQIKKERQFLSTSDQLVHSEKLRALLKRKFPKATEYEADAGRGSLQKPGRRESKARYVAIERFNYNGTNFNPGDILPAAVVEAVRLNKSMDYVWKKA